MNTNILEDFQICISVPLMGNFIFCAVIIIRITSKRWPIGTTNCLSLSDHFVGLALKGLISCIDKIKFYLGLIKLRIAFLNSRNYSVFLISSMSLAHSLTVHGNKDDSNILVCAESCCIILF